MDIMKRILNSPMSGRRANRSSQGTFTSSRRSSQGHAQSSTLPARFQQEGVTSGRVRKAYFGILLDEIVVREEREEELEAELEERGSGNGKLIGGGVPRLVVNLCRYISQYGAYKYQLINLSINQSSNQQSNSPPICTISDGRARAGTTHLLNANQEH